MASGTCHRLAELPDAVTPVLRAAQRAVMTTLDGSGWPHAVPVVFAVDGDDVVTPIDRKPKTGRRLGRIRNLERDPKVTLLVDRWTDERVELAWIMIRGRAVFQAAADSTAEVDSIIARYPNYRDITEGSDVIRIVPERISWWSWT